MHPSVPRRSALAVVLLMLAPLLVVVLPSPVVAAEPAPRLAKARSAWVAVSVARLWETPRSPRPVDRPALASPVRFRAWLSAMSLDQRRDLFRHSDTEALLGDRVRVLRLRGKWARVAVVDQPSPKHPSGYPGWVPRRQLTSRAPAATSRVATVTRRTAWLHTDTSSPRRQTEISHGTRLPVRGKVGRHVRVVLPRGGVRRIPAAAVTLHAPSERALPIGPRRLLRTARQFRGLPYLWGGLSGFGIDCSGLTWLAHRVSGVRTPRDAAPQATAGRRVGRAKLRQGDLIFYATAGTVHHVTMYAGRGRMIEAPFTGGVVRVVPVRDREYAGARRYR